MGHVSSLYFYPQHCSKRNALALNLLWDRFWGFPLAGATRCTDWGEI